MESVSIRFGEAQLELKKSPRLIAVRPTPGAGALLALLAERMGSDPENSQVLGGFRILDLGAGADSSPIEETLDKLRAQPEVAVGTHVFHAAGRDVPLIPTGQLWIVCRRHAHSQAVRVLLKRLGLETVYVHSHRELIVQLTPASPNPLKVAVLLQDSTLIASAQPFLASPRPAPHFAEAPACLEPPVSPRRQPPSSRSTSFPLGSCYRLAPRGRTLGARRDSGPGIRRYRPARCKTHPATCP